MNYLISYSNFFENLLTVNDAYFNYKAERSQYIKKKEFPFKIKVLNLITRSTFSTGFQNNSLSQTKTIFKVT